MDVRPIRPDEVDAFLHAVMATFGTDAPPHLLERFRDLVEPARTHAALDEDGTIVGCAGACTRTMTVPGGPVPVAHTTLVGVAPTHRRRGLLRRLLARVHGEAPEALAALWASEATIYGRFGYGPAARGATLRLQRLRTAFRPDAPPAAPVRLVDPRAELAHLQGVLARVRAARAGVSDRSASWWARALADPEAARAGASSLRCAVVDGGYALYAVEQAQGRSHAEHVVRVRELLAATPAAHAALWRFLGSLDLTGRVEWRLAPVDEPLPHLLEDPRAVELDPGDTLWVALLDVPRALAQRTYATPLDLVLAVDGERLRLRAGTDGRAEAAPTEGPADLVLGREALGAAYLGGTTLAELHAAGRVAEHRPGAVAQASVAFRGVREPWGPEVF